MWELLELLQETNVAGFSMEDRAEPSPFRYDKVEWEFGVHPVVMSLYEVCSQ